MVKAEKEGTEQNSPLSGATFLGYFNPDSFLLFQLRLQ